MSMVIDFPASAPLRPRSAAAGGPCEVIIFPGVRIERSEFNLADRVGVPRRRPASPNQAADLDKV